jgi:predicted ATPase
VSGPRQPSGEVTLVFTDIEGSTRLLEELGTQGYREALAEHRRIVREACSRYRGYEVDYEGDAFFYAFSSAPDAVSAVSEAMAGLADGPISIRVGIHTGSPEPDPPKYVGMDVHTAARIMSSGHGGQVVVSPTTASLVDVSLAELGEHRLKDLEQAIPLYQLGDGSFPPLKTISNTNLPRPASSFVGREAELEEVLSRVEQGARLVTLTGPGGTGKTRLGLEAATSLVGEYKAGVFWVGLASLRDPALVTETISQVLGAKDGLAEHIGERELLLLLDNLEQVVECAPELSALLQSCANLTLLVTSRELLRVSGEVEYPVPPLASPEAVALFCERAQLEPTEEIAELCARLDSLPLAVELAAARTKALTPAQIRERLTRRLDVLRGGRDADPRQHTLRATIEWSYELLTHEEQQLFARLSVFAGGCTLEAAEEVADADLDTLQSLVEKSLLRFREGRYWMLETIREYAGERLQDASDEHDRRRAHAMYYLELAERAEENESREPSSVVFARLGDEHDNTRSASSWFRQAGESDCQLRLACALAEYWNVRGHLGEGLSHVEAALVREDASPALRVKTLALASDLARMHGDTDRARGFCEESVALAREIEDYAGVARALHELGEGAIADEDFDRANQLFQEAVTVGRAAGVNAAGSIGNLGYVAFLQQDYERAQALYEESVSLFRARGHESGALVGLCNLVEATVMLGRPTEARLRIKECLPLARELGFVQMIAQSLDSTAAVLADSGDARTALRLVGAADVMLEELNLSEADSERRIRDRAVEASTRALGPAVARSFREEGRSLDTEQAIELALLSLD